MVQTLPGCERGSSAAAGAKLEVSAKATQRYVTLDGMRGVAAIAVVLGHVGEAFGAWQPTFFYTAVDLFFVLSGFVLALNYDGRFAAGMTSAQFMRLRAIRLFPLALIGAALGLVSQLLVAPTALGQGQAVASFLLTALALPTPPLAAPAILFPLNSVFWSLFLELWIANLAFALLWKPLRGIALWVLIAAAAIGLLGCERWFHYMNVGWSWANIAGGFPRVGYSFFVGVAIARRHVTHPGRFQPLSWLCLALLAIAFSAPVPGKAAQLVSLAYILVVMPFAVHLGATAKTGDPRLGAMLGDASYAVYATHLPILTILATVAVRPLAIDRPSSVIFALLYAAFAAAALALALAVDRLIDRPARRWLSTNLPGRGGRYSA